nr:lasso peptide biosynthesis B2 protein [Streptomyces spiramenti]
MDIRRGRGRWVHLNPAAAQTWRVLTSGPDDAATRRSGWRERTRAWSAPWRAGGQIPAGAGYLPPPQRAAPQAASSTAALYLPSTPRTAADAAPAQNEGERLSGVDRAAVALATLAALASLHLLPIRVTLGWVTAAARFSRREPGAARAAALHTAVIRAGRRWPGRFACLEETLATTLAARLRGDRLTLCLGARPAPVAAHAWTETTTHIIGQSADDRPWPYITAARL